MRKEFQLVWFDFFFIYGFETVCATGGRARLPHTHTRAHTLKTKSNSIVWGRAIEAAKADSIGLKIKYDQNTIDSE